VFADVPASHPFAAAIAWMAGEGITEGYGDGTFRPTLPVTRMAMAAFLHRYVDPAADAGCGAPPFPDVPVSHPFCAEITWMVGAGITAGYDDGTFRPDALVTRQAAAAFLHRLAGAPAAPGAVCPPAPFPDVAPASPFCEAIAWLDGEGITTGYDDGTFRPAMVVTRMAMAALLQRYEVADAAPVPSAGCGTSEATPVVDERRDLAVGDSARWFLHTVPTAHDGVTPLPLVLDVHGLAEGAQIHTAMSEASTFAEAEGFVVAFPHGRFDPVRWDAADQTDGNEDLRFVDAIVATLGDELCLDESRVYAMGLSYGGFMTSLLSCARSDTFAAVAPVAGVRAPEPCEQERAVPILAFHGTADAILPYGPYPGFVATWAARNGCDPDPVDTPVTDEVVHRVYDCPRGADVELYTVLEGGHTWPGSPFSQQIEAFVGYTTFDIHATAEAWAFFERHRL
jgi:polyhydroxybutyrate depolymerase